MLHNTQFLAELNTIYTLKFTINLKIEKITRLFSRLRSRSLSELTRQITPPTKNDHAPPPTKSRKSFNLSILIVSGPGEFPRVESN